MRSWQTTTAWGKLLVMLVCGCATPSDEKGDKHTTSYSSLKASFKKHGPPLTKFTQEGPFQVEKISDFKIRVTKNEILNSDLYFSDQKEKAPLVIFQHGNLSTKEVHSHQAQRVASWGMHAIVLEQPNQYRWMENGQTLAKLVNLLFMWPLMLDQRFDHNNIILVGHSFGGSAVSIAAGMATPVKGLILLDPALVSQKVTNYLSKVEVPTIILGADARVFHSRKRGIFFKTLASHVTELSFKDATHNDAQYPDEFTLGQLIGLEDWTSEEKQELFAAAIAAGALSLASHGSSGLFLKSIQPEVKRGNIIKLRTKKASFKPSL